MVDGLRDIVDTLHMGLYIVGNIAYTLTKHLLIPFTGSDKNNISKDTFNYYLSKVRICVEMAFGQLVNKFQILKRNMKGSMEAASAILISCESLHNLIILVYKSYSFDVEQIGGTIKQLEITSDQDALLGMSYLSTIHDEIFVHHDGLSHTRNTILKIFREQTDRKIST